MIPHVPAPYVPSHGRAGWFPNPMPLLYFPSIAHCIVSCCRVETEKAGTRIWRGRGTLPFPAITQLPCHAIGRHWYPKQAADLGVSGLLPADLPANWWLLDGLLGMEMTTKHCQAQTTLPYPRQANDF